MSGFIDGMKVDVFKYKLVKTDSNLFHPLYVVDMNFVCITRWVCFNDPAWESSGWVGWGG